MNTVFTACLLASTFVEAARQPIRHREVSQQGISSRATQSTHSASSRSSQTSQISGYPQFPYGPDSSASIPASPASTPSRSAPSSTLSFSYSWASSLPRQTGTAFSTGFPSFSYAPSTTTLVNEDDCGGTTVNVRNATLDWWWDMSIYDPVYTLSYQRDDNGSETGWTILLPTATTDPLDLSTVVCATEETTSTITFSNATYTMDGMSCSTTTQLVAPYSTAVTITGFPQPTAFSGTGYDVPALWSNPPPAATAVANTTFEASTNFVYFTQYEIESSNFTRKYRHQGICNTITKTYNLSEPYAFTYTGDSPESASSLVTLVADNLDSYFPTAIGQPNITVGSFTAVPTVIYVVEQVVAAQPVAHAFGKTMMSATRLDIPSPTLPSGVSSTSDNGYDLFTSLVATAQIESTDLILIIPSPSTTRKTAIVVQSLIAGDLGKPEPTTTSDPNAIITALLGGAILHGLGSTTTDSGVAAAGTTLQSSIIGIVIVDGQTAVPGGPAITVSGTPISVPSRGNVVVIGDTTIDMPKTGAATTVGGVQISEAPVTALTGAGQTLVPGGNAITISGTPVSLVPGGGALIIGTSTSLLTTRIITLGSQTFTADASSRFIIAGTTLVPDGTAVVSGTTLVLGSGATAVVINGVTSQIKPASAPSPVITRRPALTIDGHIIVPSSNSFWVISGKTLTPGGAITFSDGNLQAETVSLDAAGSTLVNVVAGKTTTTQLSTNTIPVMVINGHTYTANSGSGSTYVVEGHTLTNGGIETVTVDGSTYVVSLASTPTMVSIRQVSGSNTAATVESLWTAEATVDTTSTTTLSATSAASPLAATLQGQAVSLTFEMLSVFVTGAALLLGAWL